MDCRRFELRLAALEAGVLDGHELAACEHHAAGCESCGELLRLARLEPMTDDEQPVDLAPSVLAATGDGCEAARRLAAAEIDGALERLDAALLEEHAAGCGTCRELRRTLARLAVELPWLAELDPGGDFVDEVLAATLPWSIKARRWWAESWPRWVRRPRFAIEAAYVGVLFVVVFLGATGTPLAAVPERAAELTRQGTERVRASSTATEIEEAAVQAKGWWEEAGSRLGTLWDSAASLLENAEEATHESTETDP